MYRHRLFHIGCQIKSHSIIFCICIRLKWIYLKNNESNPKYDMGKRSWLDKLLNHHYLPLLSRLRGSDEDQIACQRLAQQLRVAWTEHGQSELKQQQSLMDQTRRTIKNRLGEEHFSLDFIKFTTQEYTWLNEQKQRSVAERNEDVKQIGDPDRIVVEAVRLLDSPEWAKIAAGLAVLTGRRSSELLSTADFKQSSKWSVTFSGALKRKGEIKMLCFEIPTLATAARVCEALARLRQQLPEAGHLPAQEVNARYGQAVANVCDRTFCRLVPPRQGGNLYTHLFRAVYATIATFWYCPAKVDPVEFRAAIQGHYAVIDEANPELRRSLAASRHYADFEIADEVIAEYGGKRKGIKLGIPGVQVIEVFRGAIAKDHKSVTKKIRKHRSSLRIWKEDRDEIMAVLEAFTGKNQADKVAAWAEWSRATLQAPAGLPFSKSVQMQPGMEEVGVPVNRSVDRSQAQAAPTQKVNPPEESRLVARPMVEPDHESATGLERKIDELVGAMSQLVQVHMAQMQQQQAEAVAGGTTLAQIPNQPSLQCGSEVTLKRKYKTGADEAAINMAIDAIMAHNDVQVLHDHKWAITINALKAFSKNQRVIERILGKGKNNPGVTRLVGAREDEVEKHHKVHQIQPSHNHRHKRKRKIAEVIQL